MSHTEMLKNLSLDRIMTLPPPVMLWEETPTAESLYAVAERFYRLWLDLLSGALAYPDGTQSVNFKCGRCNNVHTYEHDAALQRVLMIVGYYYGWCAHQLVTFAEVSDAANLGIPGCSPSEYLELKKGNGSSPLEWSRSLLYEYVGVLQAARTLFLVRRGHLQADLINDQAERILADSVFGVFNAFDLPTTAEGEHEHGMEAATLARRITGYSMHLQCSVYRWPLRPWSETHTVGPFSMLKLAELQLLASQDLRVQSRYGAKKVEKLFESQLALLMQSLGFYVIRTRSGERTVDLVCISGDPTASFTIMLEAKTSKAAYSLPTKDERALTEYVSTVQDSLTTSPKLGLLLVVGSSAGRTLTSKLRRLELGIGVPVRFCRAQELATLRESIVAPMPLGVLVRELIKAPHVVPESCIVTIASQVNDRASAQEALVKTFMKNEERPIPPVT